MQFLDARGCVIKTPEVTEQLHKLVLADPTIMSVAAEVTPDPQSWGSSGLHFSARLIGSGAPALLKINVAPDQLWWTRSLAHAYPELLPRVFAAGERLGTVRL